MEESTFFVALDSLEQGLSRLATLKPLWVLWTTLRHQVVQNCGANWCLSWEAGPALCMGGSVVLPCFAPRVRKTAFFCSLACVCLSIRLPASPGLSQGVQGLRIPRCWHYSDSAMSGAPACCLTCPQSLLEPFVQGTLFLLPGFFQWIIYVF